MISVITGDHINDLKDDNDLHKTIRSKLVDLIREAILSKEYMPGQRLIEEELGAKYGVSRTPIREALVVLEQEGILEIRQHFGVFVTSFNTENIVELLKIESAMESLAIAETAKKIAIQEIEKLEIIQDEAKGYQYPQDIDKFYRYDRKFHSLIIQYSKSKTIINILEKQLALMYLCRFYTTTVPLRLNHSIIEHQDIIENIKKRDSNLAVKSLQIHLDSIINDYLDMINKEQKNG